MSGEAIFGLPNHISQDYCVVYSTGEVGLEPTEMEATWIQTEEPSEVSRLLSLDPRRTLWAAVFGVPTGADPSVYPGFPRTVTGMSLVNHNLNTGSFIRFIGYSDALDPRSTAPPFKLSPNAIVAYDNTVGTYSNVDEDVSSPDGLVISPDVTANPWSVTLGFGIFGGGATLDDQENGMCVVLRARCLFQGAGALNRVTHPRIDCTLKENGTTIRHLGYRAVTSTAAGGQFLIFSFSLTELADQTAADLEIEISGTSGNSEGLGAYGYSYCVLDTLAVMYEVLPPSHTHDSGWTRLDYDDDRPAPSLRIRQFSYVPETPWTGVRSVVCLVRSDQAQHDPPNNGFGDIPYYVIRSVQGVREPESWVQAGVFVAGEGIVFDETGVNGIGAKGGILEIQEIEGKTGTGQTYGADAYINAAIPSIDFVVTREQLRLLQTQLAARRGRSGAFVLSLEPWVDMKYRQFTDLWVTLREMGEPTPLGYSGGVLYYSLTMSFEQRL